jgi:hypothetical protein
MGCSSQGLGPRRCGVGHWWGEDVRAAARCGSATAAGRPVLAGRRLHPPGRWRSSLAAGPGRGGRRRRLGRRFKAAACLRPGVCVKSPRIRYSEACQPPGEFPVLACLFACLLAFLACLGLACDGCLGSLGSCSKGQEALVLFALLCSPSVFLTGLASWGNGETGLTLLPGTLVPLDEVCWFV